MGTSRKLACPDGILLALDHNQRAAIRDGWSKAPKAFLLFILLFSFMATIASSALLSNVSVSTKGAIEYYHGPPEGLSLIYSTDFENITKVAAGGGSSYGYASIPTAAEGGVDHEFWFDHTPGANWWMEGLEQTLLPYGISPHSGTRCIGMEIPAGNTGYNGVHRAEFNLKHLNNLTGDELYVSFWRFMPDTWGLYLDNSWGSLGVAYQVAYAGYYPYCAFMIERPYGETGVPGVPPPGIGDWYRFYINYRDKNGAAHEKGPRIQPYTLPTGSWHHIEYYVYKDPTNGTMRYWDNGVLLFNVSGIQTEVEGYDYISTPLKIYYAGDDTIAHNMVFLDDLEVWGI